ncbi:MAG: rod shape-determining protein RodA [Pseudanabaenaceae cyanobacterium SKYGB_i_bin29]|nr:rod shape-determining protein RodA [Pseudanabaenaceae cyanobacterium SKYG29]MDW8422386.1 rod shape-determining protein RodA [Pseudanabaenaceae cyanobacterium SKYGB_i_bin29]
MNLSRYKGFWEWDWWLIAPCLGLIGIGGAAIYSINYNNPPLGNYWWQHLLTGGVGLILVACLRQWHYPHLLTWHWLIYGLTNVSLILVLQFGVVASGAQSWLNLAGFHVQPSEFAKISLIISIAALLHKQSVQRVGDLLRVLLVVLPPWVLVLVQPDLGTAIVILAITMGMLYWAGTPLSWLLLMCSPLISALILAFSLPLWFVWIGGIGAVAFWSSSSRRTPVTVAAVIVNLISGELGKIAWHLLHPYQRQRLVLFLNPDQDPLGGGYHLIQSRIAIGAGQLWGQGFLQGSQTQLSFIPEQHTDFVFSAIGEEWGFVGSMMVLALFFVLCCRLLLIAVTCRSNFGSLLAIGMLSLVFFQVCVNVGMTVGLAPVTGIPLPFLSYGRAALLAYLLGVGIVGSVGNQGKIC